jgi:hypothetical protein
LPRLALISPQHHNFGVTPQGMPSDDPLYAPNDYTMMQVRPASCDNWLAQTPHLAMNVIFADGSIRSIAADISPTLWKELLKPQDSRPLSMMW